MIVSPDWLMAIANINGFSSMLFSSVLTTAVDDNTEASTF